MKEASNPIPAGRLQRLRLKPRKLISLKFRQKKLKAGHGPWLRKM